MTTRRQLVLLALPFPLALLAAVTVNPAQQAERDAYLERSRRFSERIEAEGLAAPFKGITTDGTVVPGLYEIRATGVTTAPVREAAQRFIATLTGEQRANTLFPVEDIEWRKWANQHIYLRQGLSFEQMAETQRSAALALLGASLSARGLQLSRDIMRLNTTLGELNDDNFLEYGEGKYFVTMMGEPSETEPWGWQLDGHHLNLNYLVLGDQVVMTPAFWGSEPAVATSGRYAGTSIMAEEQRLGLAMIRALEDSERRSAILEVSKTGNNILAQAFGDNVIIDYAGVRASVLNEAQKGRLLDLIAVYVGNLREPHARVRMSEVEAHLDDTYFAWIGKTDDNAVFYYRIQSPVILIEFDHQTPVGLRHLYPPGVPFREHIHSVVRTPNGNDYGKDLLRQHYAAEHGGAP
jgi:Protein of unknown function (DUF3500)